MKAKYTPFLFMFFILFIFPFQSHAQNTVTILEPPTTVAEGQTIDLNVRYDNTFGDAYVLVRFKSPSGGNLDQDFIAVGTGSGTEPLSITAPSTDGAGYSLQAQLLKATDWGGLANDVVDGVRIASGDPPPSGENSVTFTATPSEIENGGTYRVSVSYNLSETSIIYLQVFDSAGAPWSKIGKYTAMNIPAGRGSRSFDVNIYGQPSASNRLEAILYRPTTPWTPVDIETPFVNLPGVGEEVVFGPPADSDPAETQYFDAAVFANQGNNAYERNLGNGYWSNWYVSPWQGPLKAYFGTAQGSAWVEWTNQKPPSAGQQEFDIKIQKYSWHSEDDGYPSRINQISNALNAESRGRWTDGSSGRGHINLTAWIYAGDNPEGDRCDIIVHTWDNSGRLRQKYDDNLDYTNPNTGVTTKFRNIGTVTDNFGVTYQVLRTKPGGAGELASFNLVPDALIRDEPLSPFPTGVISGNVGMKSIMTQVIERDTNYEESVGMSLDWRLHGMEWTFTGQSGDNVDGLFIPNSKGRFTLSSYSIPDIVRSTGLTARMGSRDSLAINDRPTDFSVSPNPFDNSLEYEYAVENDEPVTIDLYALDGRKAKTLKNAAYHRAGNYSDIVQTGNLDAGVYILRISTSKGEQTIKVVKD